MPAAAAAVSGPASVSGDVVVAAGVPAKPAVASSKFVIGNYGCDFGNVLQGGIKRKTFKV